MLKLKFGQISLFLLNFVLGGIVFSILPSGFVALFILGMQDNSASQDDIFSLKLYILIIFLVGGVIGGLIALLQTDLKKSALIGAFVSSAVILGFFLLKPEKNQGTTILVYLFYVLPGIVAGLACGFLINKTKKM